MCSLSEENHHNLYPQIPWTLLEEINEIAKKEGFNHLFLVGGAIRDSLINQLTQNKAIKIKDIDLLLEGSATKLAEKIFSKFGKERVSSLKNHQSFNTVDIVIDDILIDIASARTEIYPVPAENPIVSLTNIEHDLSRRDFTINAIAMNISSGELIDLHNGKDSIYKHNLDFIHSKSVKEDPTRIIRGARYAAKLNFSLSLNSINQIKETIENWPWQWSPEMNSSDAPAGLSTRLKFEIERLLQQETWVDAINLLQDWGALKLLDDKIQDDYSWEKRINLAIKLELEPLIGLIAISENSYNLAKRLGIAEKQKQSLYQTAKFDDWIKRLMSDNNAKGWEPSQWSEAIESNNWTAEVIAISICKQIDNWEPLFKWLTKWRHIKSPISAKELIEKGWETGPSLGEELARLRAININKSEKI